MIEIKQVKNFLRKLPQTIAEHMFWSFLVLFFIAAVCGAILFYRYDILAKNAEPQAVEAPVKIDEALYQKLSDIWQGRKEAFGSARTQKYPDPFK